MTAKGFALTDQILKTTTIAGMAAARQQHPPQAFLPNCPKAVNISTGERRKKILL
jgi:hypothetical protein